MVGTGQVQTSFELKISENKFNIFILKGQNWHCAWECYYRAIPYCWLGFGKVVRGTHYENCFNVVGLMFSVL